MKKFALMLSLASLAATFSACGSESKDSQCNDEFKNGCYKGVYLECVMGKDGGQVSEKESVEFNHIAYTCDDSDALIPDDYSCKDGKLDNGTASYDYICDVSEDNNVFLCKDGAMVKEESVTVNGVKFVCNDSHELVPDGYTCSADGKLMHGADEVGALCDPMGSASMFVCQGDRIVKNDTVLVDNTAYVCINGILAPSGYSCKEGQLMLGESTAVPFCSAFDSSIIFGCDGDQLVRGRQLCSGNDMIYCDGGAVKSDSCDASMQCMSYERDNKFFATCVPGSAVTEGCDAGVTADGKCDGSGALVFCSRKDASKGKTITLDCNAEGKACMFIDDRWGYDCSAQCSGDNGVVYNEHGLCDANVLHYCGSEPADAPLSHIPLDCSMLGKTCGFAPAGYFDCL